LKPHPHRSKNSGAKKRVEEEQTQTGKRRGGKDTGANWKGPPLREIRAKKKRRALQKEKKEK